MVNLNEIICCPRCLSALDFATGKPMCTSAMCTYARDGFPTSGGQPVLVDFDQSVFSRANYNEIDAAVLPSKVKFAGAVRDYTNRSFRTRLRELLFGSNFLASQKGAQVLEALKNQAADPRLLIIGGGALGGGVDAFYGDDSVQVVATDVYASPNTCLLADAHCLPFKNEVFDGVWITAVLEHVLEPHVVVEQIYRVLKPGGLIYAETPFMQQVHEGPHDFTRFTRSGHRWLFRKFDQIDAGILGGPGSAVVWAIRYFWRGLGTGDKGATLLTAPFFWIRYFDRFMHGHQFSDGALGVFFFGRKTEHALHPKDIIAYYANQR